MKHLKGAANQEFPVHFIYLCRLCREHCFFQLIKQIKALV